MTLKGSKKGALLGRRNQSVVHDAIECRKGKENHPCPTAHTSYFDLERPYYFFIGKVAVDN
jgi:hypothetical protein